METITFRDYKKAIKSYYLTIKPNYFSGVLDNPSPAQIRTLCIALCEKEFSKKDDDVFRIFFETKEGELLKKSIENCNIDRFRPIISFLKNETDTENRVRVEIAAILIGFESRPFSEFSKTTSSENLQLTTITEETDETVEVININHRKSEDTRLLGVENNSVKNKKEKKNNNLIYYALALTMLLITGYFSKEIIFPEKQCMVWKEDHYEEVDCKNEVNSFYNLSKEVKNKEALSLKKIDVCDTTTFFVNDKPVVWYGKSHGNHDFFNQDGTHPITGKDLKPVTDYIIKKHVKPCK